METYLYGYQWYKKYPLKILSHSFFPAIFSSFGFAYIGIPSNLQITIRRLAPQLIREHLLIVCSTDTWLVVLLAVSLICCMWVGLSGIVAMPVLKQKLQDAVNESEQLKQECDNKSIDCYRLFSNYLYGYCNSLGFSANERISLYKLDLDIFSCIGRYSENERFNSKPSRLYPKNQGCISRAWEKGEFGDNNAPDPKTDLTSWQDYMVKNFNFSKQEISQIRMKSRAFFGIRLKDTNHETLAVIIFESLGSDGLQLQAIKNLIEKDKMNLVNLIVSLKSHIPTLEEAKSQGF